MAPSMVAFAFSTTSLRSRSPPDGVATYVSVPRTRTSTSPTSDSAAMASHLSPLCHFGLRLPPPLDFGDAMTHPLPKEGCFLIGKGAESGVEPHDEHLVARPFGMRV